MGMAHFIISFLQSPEWERIQQQLGRKTWRIDGILVIEHSLPMGLGYLYSPRPPFASEEAWRAFLSSLRSLAGSRKSLFSKIDSSDFFSLPEKIAPYHASSLQPRATVIIDLKKSEDTLLGLMHPKTRYNIRVAQRSGVEIGQTGDFEEFWSLLKETAERERFSPHGKMHYETLLAAKTEEFSNELFFARARGKAVAASLVNFYRPSATVTYLHGASSRADRNLMAPHALHWSIITEAQRRGFSSYDLWGVDEVRWPGVTRFKKSFGGYEVAYPESVDIVHRPLWYRMYAVGKRLKDTYKS